MAGIKITQAEDGAVLFTDNESTEPYFAVSALAARAPLLRRRALWKALRDYAVNRLAALDRVEVAGEEMPPDKPGKGQPKES